MSLQECLAAGRIVELSIHMPLTSKVLADADGPNSSRSSRLVACRNLSLGSAKYLAALFERCSEGGSDGAF